jgi:membrane protein CcdC involved in cytochrome C biogenesis
VTAVCYTLILYSFWGYIAKLYVLFGYAPVELLHPCSLVGGDLSLAVDLDEYVPLDSTNCRALVNAQLYQLDVRPIFAESGSVTAQLWLAWVDVLNAAAWLGVVVILEADVWRQRRDVSDERYMAFSKVCKVILYGTLLLAATYWGVKGDFVDVWDAILWILAFVFIEMNFFEWQDEIAESYQRTAAV